MTWKKQQQALNITDMHKWMIQIDIPIVSEATAIDDLSVLPQNASLTSAVTITGVGPISQTNERDIRHIMNTMPSGYRHVF